MSTYEEWAKAMKSYEQPMSVERAINSVGPDMSHEERARLEELSKGDNSTGARARNALEMQGKNFDSKPPRMSGITNHH
jgi:hypothetical protein